ncbi:MAG: hypothetical protein JWM87_742 [Candidatus Eremiobacteraeota bacterium]|nr:hypothetical protein [Candidatus Eremiobacteraeota bacterium]
MGNVDEKLTVTVATPGTDVAAKAIENFDQRLAALEQAYIKTTAAGKAHADSHKSTADAMQHGTKAAHEHVDAMTNVAEHVSIASKGLGVLGLEADAAAVKVDGLAAVVRGLGAAAPELLAIGAVVAIGAAAFSFLKESVDEAARSERELVTIGALLKNQSVADWKEQTKAVDEYAANIARTSVFQKTDALAGIQAMLTAGLSYNDAIRSQSAAMELAVATTTSLASADQMLAAAYDGRTRTLVKLGLITKEEANNGILYETILQRIHDRMGGSAAAALDSFSGKVQNLANLTGLLKEEFGTALLPVLGAFEDAMRGGVVAMQPLADEFRSWAQQNLPELKLGAQGFGDLMIGLAERALPAVEHGTQIVIDELAKLGKSFGTSDDPIDKFKAGLHDAGEAAKSVKTTIDAIHSALAPLVEAMKLYHQWQEAGNESARQFGVVLNPADLGQQTQALMTLSGWVKSIADYFGAATEGAGKFLDRLQGITDAQRELARVKFFEEHGGSLSPTASDAGEGRAAHAASQSAANGWNNYLIEQAKRLGIDPAFAMAIKRAELGGSYDGSATSPAGAIGPMQVMPGEHGQPRVIGGVSYTEADLRDPAKNVVAGLTYLAEQLQHFHRDKWLAAAAYNAGPGAVDKFGGIPKFSETRDYVSKVAMFMGERGIPGREFLGRETPHTDKSPRVIPGAKHGTPEGYDPPAPSEVKRDKVDPFTQAAKQLKADLDAITRSEEDYAKAVALAGGADERAIATLDLKKKTSADAAEEIAILNSHVKTQQELQPRLTEQLKDEDQARRAAIASLNAFNAAHKGTKLSNDDKDELKRLEKSKTETAAEYDRTRHYIEENNAQIEAMLQKIGALVPKTYEYKAALKALSGQLVDQQRQFADEAATYGQSLETQRAYWEQRVAGATSAAKATEYALKVADAEQAIKRANTDLVTHKAVKDQAVQEELATYGLSLEAQIAYYTARFSNLKRENKLEWDEYAALYDKIQDLHKQFTEQWQTRESGWLDGIIKHTTSLRDTLKNIWSTIFDDLAKSFEQKIVHGAMFTRLNDMIAKAFGLPTAFGAESPNGGDPSQNALTASTKAVTAATTTRTTAETTATTATQAATAALGGFTTALQVAASAAGSGSASALSLGGGKDGLNIGSIAGKAIAPGTGVPTDVTQIAGRNIDLSLPGQSSMPGGAAGGWVNGGGLNFSGAGAMQGLMIAQLVNGMTGGNPIWGSVGGAIGGAFFGPVGSAVGSLIGGQFGPHWGPASNYPDRSDPSYKPWLDAYNNGSPSDGGFKLEAALKNINPATLSGQMLADYNYLKGLGGSNGDLGIKNEHNGVFTFGSGLTASVADFRAAVDRFSAASSSLQFSSLFTITRSYPDPNIGHLSANGTYTPQTITVNPNGASSTGSGSTGTGGGSGGGGTANRAADVHVHVAVQGNVIGATPEDLGNAIAPAVATALNRRNANLTPGGGTQWSGAGSSRYARV